MIEVVTPDIAFLYRDKLDAMHRLRHRVFKERMDWDVNSRDGKERDVYDLLRPIYLLATDEVGRVNGSLRVLPTTGPYMLRDVFPELLEGQAAPTHPQIWEISRLAVEGSGEGAEQRKSVNRVTGEVFAGLVEWALMFGIKEICCVYDVRIGRLVNLLGLYPKWVSEPRQIGKTVAVAGRYDVSDAVLKAVRDRSGLGETVLYNRDPLEVQHAA
ncbi:acyl-homoserine-lactone synthase [Ferruginivarius sediminum]|uniref:Acyl-homoserine-lactone synthase n=1 Tax=Ferruginivarius sediminum TaxID=2661937 RepID=A0A369T8Q6_9PROT|nr:acyl-homoserine-lactone synthase [Ferruginivarius sediminum]RDD61711.1 conjugal transfer protein TraI [Ferruginivarius sediminum]